MAFGAVTERQDDVGEDRGFIPGRRHGDMAADEVFVRKRFNPTEAIGVGPDRVVDPREIGIDFATTIFEEVRKQNGELISREWKFLGPEQFIP